MRRRALAMLIALCLAVMLLPASVLADEVSMKLYPVWEQNGVYNAEEGDFGGMGDTAGSTRLIQLYLTTDPITYVTEGVSSANSGIATVEKVTAESGTVYWRVALLSEGDTTLTYSYGGSTYGVSVHVSDGSDDGPGDGGEDGPGPSAPDYNTVTTEAGVTYKIGFITSGNNESWSIGDFAFGNTADDSGPAWQDYHTVRVDALRVATDVGGKESYTRAGSDLELTVTKLYFEKNSGDDMLLSWSNTEYVAEKASGFSVSTPDGTETNAAFLYFAKGKSGSYTLKADYTITLDGATVRDTASVGANAWVKDAVELDRRGTDDTTAKLNAALLELSQSPDYDRANIYTLYLDDVTYADTVVIPSNFTNDFTVVGGEHTTVRKIDLNGSDIAMRGVNFEAETDKSGTALSGGIVWILQDCTFQGYDVAVDCTKGMISPVGGNVFEGNRIGILVADDGTQNMASDNGWSNNAFLRNETAVKVTAMDYLLPYALRISDSDFIGNDRDFDVSVSGDYYFYRNFYGSNADAVRAPQKLEGTDVKLHCYPARDADGSLILSNAADNTILNSVSNDLLLPAESLSGKTIDVVNDDGSGPQAVGTWDFPAQSSASNDVRRIRSIRLYAEDLGFNAGLEVSAGASSIAVRVNSFDALMDLAPTLTVPCPEAWENASVTDPYDVEIPQDVSFDAENHTVTFPVFGGGTYTVTKADAGDDDPKPDDPKPDNPRPSAPSTPAAPSGTTTTTTNADGSVTTTTTAADGSKTETTRTADGTTATAKSDADGSVTQVTASVSATAAAAAQEDDGAVTLPVTVVAADSAEDAPEIDITLPKTDGPVQVEVPVSNATAGTVAVLVHEDGTEEIIKGTVPTEDGVEFPLEGSALVKIVDNTKTFSDVAADSWANEAITFTASREIFNGTGSTTFSPKDNMTRGMLMTVLARYDGADAYGADWQAKGMAWAVEAGISDGSSPEENITREQLVTMLWRYAGEPQAESALEGYSDRDRISDYAKTAIAWAVEHGVMQGSGGRLDPSGSATREQVAQFFMNYVRNA